VLAQFPSAELAVRAAIMLSNGYVQRSDAIGRIEHLRIGVHLADVAVAADGDLYGDGVNTAARIQEAAEPGQVVISQDVWRQLRGRPEFRFEHLGNRSLKGIGPMGLYVGTMESDATSVSKSSDTDDLRSQTQRTSIRSLAVLPFADLSAERLTPCNEPSAQASPGEIGFHRIPIGSSYVITHGFRRSLSGSRGVNRDGDQRQQSPRTAARPSLIRNGISARAATLSSHHQPSNQVAAKPTIKTMER